MDQTTDFQLQYPLSPKKFWKKIFASLFSYLVLSGILGSSIGIIGFFALQVRNPENNSISSLVGLIIMIGAIIYAITMSLRAWYIKTYIRRYYYTCNDQFVTIQKGVFAPTEIHVQYQKIQDVYVDQDILDRIMGLYDVHIASATVTSGIEAHIDGVEKNVAEALKNLILGKMQGPTNIATTSDASLSAPIPHNPRFESTQKISTETYPISGAWIFTAIWGSGFIGLIAAFFTNSFFRESGTKGISPSFIYIFLIAFVISIIYLIIWKQNYYFELRPDYILLRTGVIGKQEKHIPYKAIQNIIKRQGVIERMLGLSTLVVENAVQVVASNSKNPTNLNAGIMIVGQPYQKAEELSKILNTIISSQADTSATMGV
jgi:putative membrane protein